jgi:tetratricopeptide (TPR) repeat protein
MKNKIEELIEKEDWPEARKEILSKLEKDPEDHWLLTRLGLTYYEERDYEKALKIEEMAYRIAPHCPLVLWDYAGTLQMLGRHKEAIKVYRRILAKGIDEIAYGECGEGKAWGRGLIADCYYRLSDSHRDLGEDTKAVRAFETHLDLRGPGCHSIYPLGSLNKKLQTLKNKRTGLNQRVQRIAKKTGSR